MATFLEICKSVRAQAGIAGDGPSNVTNQSGIYGDVVRWVEESYNEIQTLHENWNFLYTDSAFTLPASTYIVSAISSYNIRQFDKQGFTIKFQSEDRKRLKWIPWAQFKNSDKYLLDEESGEPEYITETPNGDLRFYPIPEEEYSIGYIGFSRPNLMSTSTDEPIFEAQYHDLIKLLALLKYAEYYNAQEVYSTANINYKILLSKMQFSELPRDSTITIPFA